MVLFKTLSSKFTDVAKKHRKPQTLAIALMHSILAAFRALGYTFKISK